MRKKWEEWEVTYLCDNYGKIYITEIAKHLDRSKSSVMYKSVTLGLKGSTLGIMKTPSKEEIENRYSKSKVIPLEPYNGCHTKIKHLCPFCKTEFLTTPYNIFRGHVKSCRCTKEGLRKGTKYISGRYFTSIQYGAIKRGIEFDVTIEYISELLIAQEFKCALSDVVIAGGYNKVGKTVQTCSLDRIDSSKGYIEGNVQWLHKDINKLKWALSQEEFIKMCKLVANKFKD